MIIDISKSDYADLLSLIDRAGEIIRCKSPTVKEYNVARRLHLITKRIRRKNDRK